MMLDEQRSPEQVSKWLDERKSRIGPKPLRSHRAHILATARAKTSLANYEAKADAGIARVVADVTLVDEVASYAIAVVKAQHAIMTGSEHRTLADVQLYNGCLKQAVECVMARHELLNGKKVEVNAVVSGGLAGLFAELERRGDVEA